MGIAQMISLSGIYAGQLIAYPIPPDHHHFSGGRFLLQRGSGFPVDRYLLLYGSDTPWRT
jgi:hypothetical protein